MADYYELSTNLSPDAQSEENRVVNKSLTKLPAPYLSGLKLQADIKLGDLTLNTIDDNDVVWVCTDIDGWWNLPDPEIPDLPRGWGDGSYDARGRYAARLLTLTGAFMTQEPGQVEAARQKLFKAIDLVYEGGDLVVNESPVVKTSFVRLQGRPQIATVSARGRTEFSIGLKAPDPIKYEYLTTGTNIEDGYRYKTVAAGANAAFVNEGTTKSPVIIELTGPIAAGVTIVNTIDYGSGYGTDTTETITVTTAVPSGSTLEIDTLNREAILVTGSTTVNGRSYLSTLSDWIYLQPSFKATNTIALSGSTGSAKIFYRSGWIG